MTDRSKPGSKGDRDGLRHQMLAVGCTTSEIATEMRVRYRMRPREAWRHAHGWTLQTAADRITEAAASTSPVAADASLTAKWEKWPGGAARRPSVPVILAMASAYGCEPGDLLDIDDRRALPDTDLRALTRPAPPTVEPQPVPAQSPTLPTTDLVHLAADESATWAQWAEASNVGDLGLEQMLAEIRTLAGDYLVSDPVVLFGRTRRLRDRVFGLLEGHQYPRQSRELYAASGYLCALLAWMSSDLGQLRDADTQGRTAWLCAELADHDDLRAWVLSTRSKVAFWDGRLRDAVAYARRGASCRPSGTVSVLLACQEADAWSVIGAHDESLAALHRAEDARAALTGTDEVGGILSCQPSRQDNYAAAVHLRGGRPADALRATTSALALLAVQPVRAYGTEAQIHISQASAHLATGDVDGAREALAPVLAMPPDHRLAPVARRLSELSAVIDHRAPGAGVIGLRAAITDWCADSAPRHLALSPGAGSADLISG
ncbi:XRE family transcriptional regulator [Streptomyces griseoviridis]